MLTWILRGFLGLAVLIVALAAAVLLIEPELDLTAQRATIAKAIGDRIGRDVHLNGKVHLALGLHPGLTITEIAIANPPWATSEHLFRAGEASVGIALPALFSGVLHIEQVTLREAAVALETANDGRQSWDLDAGATEAPAPDDAGGGPDIVLEHVGIEDFTLVYHDKRETRPLEVRLDHFTQTNDTGMLVLDAGGHVNDLDLRLDGRVGTLSALLAARDIAIKLHATLGETVFTLDGRFGDPERLEDIALSSTVRGPSLAGLLQAFGVDTGAEGDIDLSLTISDLEHGFAWQSAGRLGPLMLDADGKLERPLALNGLDANIRANGEDLAVLGDIAGIKGLPAQAYRLEGAVSRSERGLELRGIVLKTGRSSLKLSGSLPRFPQFKGGSTRLELLIPEPDHFAGLFDTTLKSIGPLQARLTLTPETAGDTLSAAITLGRNRLTLNGPIGSHPDYRGTRLGLDLAGPNLAALAHLAGMDGLAPKAYRLSATVTVGDDGNALLQLDDGQLGDLAVSAKGVLGRPPAMDGTDLQARLHGESLRTAAGRLAGTDLPPLPFTLQTRLVGSLTSPVIDGLTATVGQAKLETTGRIGLPPALSGTDTRFDLTIPQPAELVPALAQAGRPTGALHLVGELRKTGRKLVLKNIQIDGDQLQARLDATIPQPFTRAGLQVDLQATNRNLAALIPATAFYRPPQAELQTNIRISTTTNQLRFDRLELVLADAKIHGSGAIALGATREGSDLVITAEGPRLSDLGEFGAGLFLDEAFKLHAVVKQTARGYQVRDLSARVGDGELSGRVDFEQRDRPYIGLQADLRGLDFGRLLPVAETEEDSAPKDESSKRPEVSGRLIPDRRPDLGLLRDWDAKLQMRGEGLVYPDPVFAQSNLVRRIDVDALLENGRLTVKRFAFSGDRGDVAVNGDLESRSESLTANGHLTANGLRVGLIAPGESLERLPAHDLEVTLSTSGLTYRELAASMNGKLHMTGGRGTTTNTGLDEAFGSFFAKLVSAINPFSRKEKHSIVECSAASAEVTNGVIHLSPGLVIRTDKLDISANGSIDLGNGQIDVRFKNLPREGIGLSAAGVVRPYVKVGGTLATPGLTLDAPSALLSGTAAIATGGLSIVATGLLDRLSTTASNPCAALIAAGRGRHGETSLNPLDALGDALEAQPSRPADTGGTTTPSSVLDYDN